MMVFQNKRLSGYMLALKMKYCNSVNKTTAASTCKALHYWNQYFNFTKTIIVFNFFIFLLIAQTSFKNLS